MASRPRDDHERRNADAEDAENETSDTLNTEIGALEAMLESRGESSDEEPTDAGGPASDDPEPTDGG